MSLTLSTTPSIRTFAEVAGRVAVAAGIKPRDRGNDRRVRRNCVDENEPAAQPWDRNRFGSTHERIATSEALVDIVKQLEADHNAAFPRGRLQELERARALLAAELDALMGLAPAARPIGRAAAIRIELAELDAELLRHSLGIRRTDVVIYEAMFTFLCFAGSGRWFPSWAAIAKASRCCEKSVGRAIKRLNHHGLLAWVSRSMVKPERDGRCQRQRVQTSHAYFLDLRKRMTDRMYQRFLQLRARRHKRMTARKDAGAMAAPPPTPSVPPSKDVAEQRASIASLGAALLSCEGHGVRV